MSWELSRSLLMDFVLVLQMSALGFQVWALIKQYRLRKSVERSMAERIKDLDDSMDRLNLARDRVLEVQGRVAARMHAMGLDDDEAAPPSRLH